MRSLLIGIYSGLVLSALRAPLGLELLQVPATAPGAAMAYRAGALLVVALGLILGTRKAVAEFSPVVALIGAAVGYQIHWQVMDTPSTVLVQGLFSVLLVASLVAGHRGGPELRPNKLRIVLLALAALGGWYLLDLGFPEGHGQAVGSALVGLLALTIVGRCTDKPSAQGPAEDEAEPGDAEQADMAPARGGLTAVAIGGAGLAILVEGLARHLRLLGGGLPADDSVFGSVFLGLAAFGALAFARSLRRTSSVVTARGLCLAASGLAAWGSFRVLENLADPRGLDLFLRRPEGLMREVLGLDVSLGLDLSSQGMWIYDLVLAAPVLVLPAFFCGTVLGLFRRPIEVAALLLGGAVGLVISPSLLDFEWGVRDGTPAAPELLESSHSAAVALFGGMLAAVGALLAFLSTGGIDRRRRLIGSVLAFGGIALCRFPEPTAIEVLSPWEKRAPQPVFVLDAPCGLVTVEPDALGKPVATLDRRALTPDTLQTRADRERLLTSWKLMGELPEDVGRDVLFVGQLTPARALALGDLGATRIDRTASWVSVMEPIELLLFDGPPNWVPGGIVGPEEARRRLNGGDYELVIVAPLSGAAPTTRNLASPESTTVVVWLDAANGVETQHFGERVLVSAPRLMDLQLAVVRGPALEALRLRGGHGAPSFLLAGEPRDGHPALDLLDVRKERSGDLLRGRLARRLADAERVPGLATALARHFEAQVVSSPFETPEQKIELDPEAVELIAAAAASPEPGALAIEAIEALAVLFRAQRKVEEIDRYLLPAAERHRPWPGLELALAQAALEFLDPETALEHLKTLHETSPGNPESLAMQAEAQQQVGLEADAVRSLELASRMAPGNHELERRLAIAWCRAGDARGPAALEEVLLEDPEDTELLGYRVAGPPPPAPAGYHPLGSHEH